MICTSEDGVYLGNGAHDQEKRTLNRYLTSALQTILMCYLWSLTEIPCVLVCIAVLQLAAYVFTHEWSFISSLLKSVVFCANPISDSSLTPHSASNQFPPPPPPPPSLESYSAQKGNNQLYRDIEDKPERNGRLDVPVCHCRAVVPVPVTVLLSDFVSVNSKTKFFCYRRILLQLCRVFICHFCSLQVGY